MRKPNIRTLGKIFTYLSDPALRHAETNSALLIVRNVEISGVKFQDLDWCNIKFIECDFAGAYELKLASMVDCTMDGCRFIGIHQFGTMKNVNFYRCNAEGETFLSGGKKSTSVVFEECSFIGSNSDINHWGDIGAYGEATFVKCKAKWFGISGDTKLTIEKCEFEEVESRSDSSEIGGVYSTVIITNSQIRGKLKMVAADLQSLTIRDTVIDTLDLSGAKVKGDIVLERVRGNSVLAGVMSVRNFIVRDSQLTGSDGYALSTAVQGVEQLIIDNCTLVGGQLKGVSLGAGRPLEANEWSLTPKNKSTVIRNCKIPRLDATWLETQHFRVENSDFDHIYFNDSRIDLMDFENARVALSLNLTNTQVKQFKRTGGIDLKKLSGLKLDGSNIKLN